MIEEKEDFFEQTPEEKPKKEKPPRQPRLRRDDPRYYDREEGRWDHITPSPYRRAPLFWTIAIVSIAFLAFLWFFNFTFSPVVEEAVQYGYVDNVHKEGKFFTCYEGVILPYKSLKDTVRPYEGDFIFSVKDQHVAAELKRQQASGNPVKVNYEVYRFKFPWRGKTNVLVTAVDSVNPSTILPPDRRPAHP